MENDKSNVDKLFKNKTSGFAPETPEDLWPGIRETMENRKSRRRAAWMRRMAVAAALILAFSAGYWLNNDAPVSRELNDELPLPQTLSTTDSASTQKNNDAESPSSQPQQEKVDEIKTTTQLTAELSSGESEEQLKSGQKISVEGSSSLSFQTSKTGEFTISMAEMIANYRAKKGAVLNFGHTYAKEQESAPDLAEVYTSQADTVNSKTAENTIAAANNHFSIIAMGGPALPFSKINYREGKPSAMENLKNESVYNTYTAGLKVSYHNFNKWEIQLGAFVNTWQQKSEGVILTSANAGNNLSSANFSGYTSTGEVNIAGEMTTVGSGGGNVPQSYILIPDLQEIYTYIDIPVNFGYYLLHRRWKLKLTAGLNTRLLSSAHVEMIYPDGERVEYDELSPQKQSWQIMAGTGLGYQFAKRFHIVLEPQFLFGLKPVDQSEAFDTYQHQFHILSGISFRI